MTARLCRSGGFATVSWLLGIGFIVLPLVIAVASIAPILSRLNAARSMAQEGARAVVLADDWEAGEERAEELARQITRNHGIGDGEWCTAAAVEGERCVSIQVDGSAPGTLERGEEVFVVVRMPSPLITIPFAGDVAAFTMQAVHTERIDDYRSFP